MHKRITALLLMCILLAGACPLSGFGREETQETEDLAILRNESFEGYQTGALFNGTAYLPTAGENKGQGVPAKDDSRWLGGAAENGEGGVTLSLSRGLLGNLVATTGKEGEQTQALQIIRPAKTSVTSAALSLQPASSIETARLLYSVDIKNSGKCGSDSNDAGYTKEVNNCFASVSLCGVTLDFNQKTVRFEGDDTARPPVSAEEYKWALPDNGVWFNWKLDIDALADTISVYIDDRLIGTKKYGDKFKKITAKQLELSAAPSGDGENAVYFDNLSILKSAMTAAELARKLADEAFARLGDGALVCFPGCDRVYFGEEIESFDAENPSVAPIIDGDQVYLPIRYLAKRYGYQVDWDAAGGVITLTGEKIYSLKTDGSSLTSGEDMTLGSALRLSGGASYLEITDAAAMFGQFAYVDASGLSMLVESKENVPQGSWKEECLSAILELYPEASLGFEVDGGWYTMADLLEASGCSYEELNITYGVNGRNNQNTSYELERNGIKRSTERVKSGKYAGKWENHPFYPTIMATGVPTDWTPYNTLSFWLYSEVDTGEHITVGAVSNPDKTYSEYETSEHTTNFYHFGIDIDFTGWKKFELPLAMFQASTELVQGFQKIDGLYFYTRAFDYEPSPYTILYVDDVKLESLPDDATAEATAAWQGLIAEKEAALKAPRDFIVSVPEIFRDVDILDYSLLLEAKKALEQGGDQVKAKAELDRIYQKYAIENDGYSYSDLIVKGEYKLGTEVPLKEKYRYNHDFPEIVNQIPAGSPAVSQAYFKEARAVYGYDPKFIPEYTTTWGDLKFNVYASRALQVPDQSGTWHYFDWSMQIQNYCENELGLETYRLRDSSFYNETKLRFDNDGDAYMCLMINGTKADGAALNQGVLAHSRDKMKTWSFYKLPRFFQKFEVLDGNNQECLEGPPVILLHHYWTNNNDGSGSLVIPEKQPDGSLVIPEEVVYCEESVVCTSEHSGKGNFCITAGGKLYIVYGVIVSPTVSAEAEALARARIPAGHQMHKLYAGELAGVVRNVGVPTYIRSYDLKTKQFDDPIFLGCAGANYDDAHNWSTISIDAEGYLHVFLIGHHFPLLYTKSAKPYDCTEWEPIEAISSGISYASINIDRQGNIYSVTRNSNRGYCFDLVLQRKLKGGTWEESRIFQYWKQYYIVWGHDVYLDPETSRLYVQLKTKTNSLELYADDWAAKDFIFPDNSKFNDARRPTGTAASAVKSYGSSGSVVRGEEIVLVSDDFGTNWRLATTEDYVRMEK